MEPNEMHQYVSVFNYTAGAATLALGVFGGYVLSRIRKDPALQFSGKDRLELLKLEHIEAERQHIRRRELEQLASNRELQKIQLEHQNRMESADKLVSLVGQDMQTYREQLRAYNEATMHIEPELAKKRDEFREVVVEEYLDDLKSENGNLNANNYGLDKDDLDQIDNIVNMKYPITSLPMPAFPQSVKKAIDFITNSVEEE